MESLTNPQAWFHQLGSYRSAEWFVDCYRMRVDDEAKYLSAFRGFYELEFTPAMLEMSGAPPQVLSPKDKAFILVTDFLLFMKLAEKNQVLPKEGFAFQLCLGYFAPSLLLKAFDKEDAKDKWGGENVFSARPSLRRSAETVYGLSAMTHYSDQEAQAKGERTQAEIKNLIQRDLNKDDIGSSPASLFSGIGGKELWVSLFASLESRMASG